MSAGLIGTTQASTRATASILVARKVLDSTKQEGQNALALIQSASAPPPTAMRGGHVNTYA